MLKYINELSGFDIRTIERCEQQLDQNCKSVRQFIPRLSLVVAFNHRNCHICSATAPSLLARFATKAILKEPKKK